MYWMHHYRDADGHDIPGTSRAAALEAARAHMGDSGGIILDDSRSVVVADGGDVGEVVRVSGDVLTPEQAEQLLALTPLWFDEAAELPRLVDRDALLAALARL